MALNSLFMLGFPVQHFTLLKKKKSSSCVSLTCFPSGYLYYTLLDLFKTFYAFINQATFHLGFVISNLSI